ncbi:hypothetical protein H4217_004429 [Coemansia sp. RSA 1939]|nr:hypothetical protein H4217_004429 [Coemansia sp. RSA 1939]
MFKKPFHTKPRTNIRSSSTRGIAQETRKQFPNAWDPAIQLNKDDANKSGDDLVAPVPDKLQAAKFVSHVGDKGEIFYDEAGEPLWLKAEVSGSESTQVLVPTVYTQWMFPTILPVLFTSAHVVEKLIGGADLMVPGLLVPESGLPDLSKGSIVAIGCPGSLAAQAIGILTFDTKNVKSVGGVKGKAVLVTHTYKDCLWESGSKKELPIIIPSDIGSNQTADDIHTDPASHVIGSSVDDSVNADEAPLETSEGAINNSNNDNTNTNTAISSDEMDDLLFTTLKQVMATVLGQDIALPLLPIVASTLYSTYMVPNSPKGKEIDIKGSNFKKLAKFLKAADKRGLLKLKEIRGEMYVKSFDWGHQEMVQYTPYIVAPAKDGLASANKDQPQTSQGSRKDSGGIIIEELFKPSRALVPLFEDIGAQTETGFFTRKQVRSVLEDYIKSRDLVDAKNSQFVKLDHRLCDGLLTKEEYSSMTVIRRDQLHTRTQEAMTLYTRVTVPGKEAKLRTGNPPTVDIICEKKMGNKVVTRVIGLEAYGIDPAEIAKELRTLCASSTTIDPVPGKKNEHSVLVQGHQVSAVTKLLDSRCKLPERLLTVVDKTGKAKKAKNKN